MATQSFYEDLVLDTPEAVARLEAVLDEADRNGPRVIHAQGVTNDPKIIDAIIRAYIQRRDKEV
ncbi:MAG: hypothetical protein Q4Q62_01835 [Thermoplasmata archaeon]|nr:hypothetical protein [Thermoplasmata archaeon]